MPPETLQGLIAEARRKLMAAGIETAALDARLLLQHAAGVSHEALIAAPERPVEAGTAARFRGFLNRRLNHEPVSRILGEREFYGRVFVVTPAVLDPRPDTETLIDEALAKAGSAPLILDLGTGSGAIAVTMLAERPAARGVATDLSAAALAVARDNALRLGVADRLTLVHGSWFDGIVGRFDLILSNPPYIPLAEIAGLAPEVREFDPLRALDGGPDGLSAYRRIAAGALSHLAAGGRVIVEIGAGQEAGIGGIFAEQGLREIGRRRDLAGHVRCLTFSAS